MLRLRPAFVAILTSAISIGLSLSFASQGLAAKFESKGKNTVTPAEENYQTALSKYKQEDIDGAIDAFLQAIYFSRNYYNPDAYFWLGVCYMQKKQDPKAIEAFNHACQQAIGPMPVAHLHLAELYFRNDRMDDSEQEGYAALNDCNKLLGRKGYVPIGADAIGPARRAHNIIGKLKEKKELFDVAQFQYEQALGDPPWFYTDAWMNLAELYMKQKEWAGAMSQFQDMLNSKRGLPDLDRQKVLLDMGLCVLAKGDHQGAIDYWHECLNYNQNYAPAHLQLAMIFDVEQHFGSAVKEYREFIRFSQDQAAVARVKGRITTLELKVAPQEAPMEAPKPSPYMQQQELQKEKQETKEKESLTSPSTAKDSGF